ncbi:zinc-binding dehydrogenase [Celerinatantimonas sp. YJH-8]|uniref:zinc-dependent alcohol dehydrogenase n=1 Tax=Celerinatantimonas sp. YJH-8 TaxID=3228714 RepID=UPI0038C23793
MKAAQLYGIGDIRIDEIAAPTNLEAKQLRLQVDAVGICGSDLHNYQTGQWMSQLPMIPGHEFTATVLEIGADVDAFQVGDKVVADSRVWCGKCPACQRQQYNHCASLAFVGEVCAGGMTEQVLHDERQLLKVPASLPPEVAVLSEPLGVSLRVIHQLAAAAGEVVKIAGGGTIGGLAALLLSDIFQHPVVLSEPNPQRYQKLNALIALSDEQPFRYAIDATGIPAVINQLIEQIEPGGRIALVGLPHQNQMIDILTVVEKEITLIGCSVFDGEQRQAIDYLSPLAGKLKQLVSPPFALEDIPSIYEQLSQGGADYLKAVIQPNRRPQ